MASSVVEVVNIALTHLGSELISSLTEGSKAAVHANAHWLNVRQAVLRAYPWACAKKWVQLAPTIDPVLNPNYTYSFLLPEDCMRVVGTNIDDDEWEIESGRMLYNNNLLVLCYVQDIGDDVPSYDPLLVQALGLRMAHTLAYTLTQSNAIRDTMWENYRKITNEARTVNSQENVAKRQWIADTWEQSRG
jgi:hypothetical protein